MTTQKYTEKVNSKHRKKIERSVRQLNRKGLVIKYKNIECIHINKRVIPSCELHIGKVKIKTGTTKVFRLCSSRRCDIESQRCRGRVSDVFQERNERLRDRKMHLERKKLRSNEE